MKMNKSKLFAFITLVATFVLAMSCLMMTACGGKEEDVPEVCAITWEIPKDVTAKAEGYETLPAQVDKNTELVFTATGPEGYNVIVKAGSSTINLKEGKYTYKVTRDVTISATAERKLTGITVTTTVDLNAAEYYVDDAVEAKDVTVTANYAVGEPELVTTGVTVVHGKVVEGVFTAGEESSKFALGDNAFQVTYKGFSSEVFELKNPAKDKFGFTKVDIEIGTDGKPYYVVYGTYSAFQADEFKHVGFDFQEQGFYSQEQGGSAGWAYVKYETSVKDEDLKDGNFVIRVDMSSLADNLANAGLPSMLFNAHMGFNPPGDNSGNLNVDTENYEEGKSVTVGDLKYELHRAPDGSENAITTWGMVGVIVSNTNFTRVVYSITGLELEIREDKVFLVYNGTCEGYTEETLKELYFDYEGSEPFTVNVDKFDGEKGEFTISFDITDMAEGTQWLHHQNATTNVAVGAINQDKITVTLGDKKYTLTDQDQWNTGGRKVIVEKV